MSKILPFVFLKSVQLTNRSESLNLEKLRRLQVLISPTLHLNNAVYSAV